VHQTILVAVSSRDGLIGVRPTCQYAPRTRGVYCAAMRPILVAVLALASLPAHAASDNNQREFIRQLAMTREFKLGQPLQTVPTPDGRAVLFLRAQPREPNNSLFELDVATGKTRELLTPEQLLRGAAEQLSPTERAQRERMRVSTRGFSHFQLSRDGREILIALSGKLYIVTRPDGKVTVLATGKGPAITPVLSPDGKKVAYVHERDLYVLDLATQQEKRLTTSKDPAISNGLAEFVAMEELERFLGFWWSGDSKSIVYEEADARGVEQLHIADPAHPEAEAQAPYYPRPGKANVKIRLGVIPVAGGATTWVGWDAAARPYVAEVRWPEHAPLTIMVMSRDQKRLDILAVDKQGKTRPIASEEDPHWLEARGAVMAWLPDGAQLLTRGVDGDEDVLQLRSADGKLVRALTRPEDHYRKLVHIDGKRRVAWFLAGPTPTERHVYRVGLDQGVPERVTGSEGEQDATFNHENHDVWVEKLVTATTMPRDLVHQIQADGSDKVVAELPSVAEKPPFMSKQELVQVGTPKFWASITRPRNFDPKKKYPVIDAVYGGPSKTVVAQRPELMRQWMADQGYIVVAIDGRGTPFRGRQWERHIAGDFSRTVDDQVEALQELGKKYPELDLSRVGITGWSFGGYLSALAVLKRPDVFRVAIAGAPVVDWRDYDTTYTERYLGLPDENKAGYEKSSLLTYAANLTRPLTLVHGTNDDNVYFFHTLKLVNALFRAGRKFEVMPIDGLTHMVADPVAREQLETRIMSAFDAALKP
jgi:dipeptidyl-peptidase-4